MPRKHSYRYHKGYIASKDLADTNNKSLDSNLSDLEDSDNKEIEIGAYSQDLSKVSLS